MVDGVSTSDEIEHGGVGGGFGLLDEKGRLSLPKPIRAALGVQPGSSIAYVILDHALLLIPQDEHLETLMRRGREALTEAGVSAQDVLDGLPDARNEVFIRAYGAEFLVEVERLRLSMQAQ